MSEDFKDFVADRNAALLSMDRAQFIAYGHQYGLDWRFVPGKETLSWISVHMARTWAKSLSIEDAKQEFLTVSQEFACLPVGAAASIVVKARRLELMKRRASLFYVFGRQIWDWPQEVEKTV